MVSWWQFHHGYHADCPMYFIEWANSSETHIKTLWTHPYGIMVSISIWIPCRLTHIFRRMGILIWNPYQNKMNSPIWFYGGNINMDTMQIDPYILENGQTYLKPMPKPDKLAHMVLWSQFQHGHHAVWPIHFREWANSSETHTKTSRTHPYGFMVAISTWIPCRMTHII